VELVKQLQDEIGMSVLWITHDLGVVAGLADKVIVMYAGHVLERAPVDDLYDDPRHPYTIGLLGSLPRLDAQTHEQLKSIEGMPPDLTKLPKGCPFAPRCRHVIETCLEEKPPLEPISPHRSVACWVDVTGGKAI
jgi:oligopeptide transport system ATP-binding protein